MIRALTVCDDYRRNRIRARRDAVLRARRPGVQARRRGRCAAASLPDGAVVGVHALGRAVRDVDGLAPLRRRIALGRARRLVRSGRLLQFRAQPENRIDQHQRAGFPFELRPHRGARGPAAREPLTPHKVAGIALALAAVWLLLGAPAPEDAAGRRESRSSLLRVLVATVSVGAGNFIYTFGLRAGATRLR